MTCHSVDASERIVGDLTDVSAADIPRLVGNRAIEVAKVTATDALIRADSIKFHLEPAAERNVSLRKICQAEIGGNCSKWPTSYLNWYWAKSGEEYWETWKSRYWQDNCSNMVAVCLWGFSSQGSSRGTPSWP